MKVEADAKLVVVYLNSTDQWHGQPLYGAVVRLCRERGVAGVTVVRCAEGYGSHQHLHTSRLLELNENVPVRVEIVDLAERIDPLLPALEKLVGEGLITVSKVRVLRFLPDAKGEGGHR
jgi:uncharacterized protein